MTVETACVIALPGKQFVSPEEGVIVFAPETDGQLFAEIISHASNIVPRWIVGMDPALLNRLTPLSHRLIQDHTCRYGHIQTFKIPFHGDFDLFIAYF